MKANWTIDQCWNFTNGEFFYNLSDLIFFEKKEDTILVHQASFVRIETKFHNKKERDSVFNMLKKAKIHYQKSARQHRKEHHTILERNMKAAEKISKCTGKL